MKNKIVIITILTFLVGGINLQAMSPLRGESYTEFGAYNIKLSDEPLVVYGEKLLTYELEYANLNHVVKIGIYENKRCKNFIVKHPGFEIQYVCSKKGFGVKMMDPQYASIEPLVINAIMDNNQYNYQQVIVSHEKPLEDLLHLVACYFPLLINNDIRASMNS